MRKSMHMKRDIFRKFRRYEEDGFINPDHDKINMAVGVTVMVLIALLFIFLLVGAIVESMPRSPFDYGQYPY